MINSALMTIEDLADYLKVTRRTIYEWVKHNKIPAVKLVGQWRFKKDKIDAWIDSSTKLTVNPERSRRIENRSLH
jgi:PTS system nitrogen regulatory IIA component